MPLPEVELGGRAFSRNFLFERLSHFLRDVVWFPLVVVFGGHGVKQSLELEILGGEEGGVDSMTCLLCEAGVLFRRG